MGTCSRCGSYYCGTCAGRSEQGAAFCARCWAGRSYVPWEDRSLGWLAGFYETIKRSLVELPAFARELPARGGFGRPLLFGMLPSLLSSLLAAGALAAFLGLMMPALAPRDAPVASGIVALIAFVAYFLMFAAGCLLYLLLWPLPLWLSARLFGGGRPPTYEGLFRILCYSSGLNLLYFFPAVGLLVMVYHVVIAVVCLARQLDTTVARATAIFLVPLGVAFFTCFGGYIAMLALAVGLTGAEP